MIGLPPSSKGTMKDSSILSLSGLYSTDGEVGDGGALTASKVNSCITNSLKLSSLSVKK